MRPFRSCSTSCCLALAFAAAGCGPEEVAEDSAPVVDVDGDGWAIPLDCEDELVGIHPGAAEYCNGSDDDCDGRVDDAPADGIPGWLDLDGDGWGDPATGSTFCPDTDESPLPWASNAGDCDDADARSHPGGYESCASPADEDCDGGTNDPDAMGCVYWYLDLDGDGWGTEQSECRCEPEGNWSAPSPGDCDDADASVSDSCGSTGSRSLFDADTAILGLPPYRGAGTSVAAVGDTDGDGWDEVLIAPALARTNTPFWLASAPFGRASDLSSAVATFDDPFHTTIDIPAVAGGVDLDGDGLSDIVLGVQVRSGSRTSVVAYVMAGGPRGDVSVADAHATVTLADQTSNTAFDLVVSPDLDGDGAPDLAMSATDGATVHVFRGPLAGVVAQGDAASTLSLSSGSLSLALAAPGDLDGDGLAELVVGVPALNGNRGGAFVQAGGTTGAWALDDATWKLEGGPAAWGAGSEVSGAGDVDGDGYPDLLVTGAYEASGGGSTWFVRGPLSASSSLDDAAARIDGTPGDYADVAAGVGDVDADGRSDVLLGAPYASDSASQAGAAFLFLGPFDGTLNLRDANLRLYGNAESDRAGYAVAPGGDLDRDGFADLLVGAPEADTGGVNAGVVYLIRGGER
jgi:hypothetical protein